MATRKTKGPGAPARPEEGAGDLRSQHAHSTQGDGYASDEALGLTAQARVEPPDITALPQGGVLGTGCGYPLGDVEVPPGAIVLDLGCGGGADCFQGFRRVQDDGLLIGEDLTEVVLERQRIAQRAASFKQVKFARGGQDALPAESSSVDLVVSNCVLNLVGNRGHAYAEIHRVLRPGGRAAISDVVTRGTLSPETRRDIQAYVGCVAQAMDREEYLAIVRAAGFREVLVTRAQEFAVGASAEGAAMNITVVAMK
ncbi:MAG: methyltransferase domain-containing protein [Candidatus Eisenbacteria bacterium]|nr:methyltransferase domain-containing protein [Candidatus Eisenbacteria bacterium]